MNKAEIKQLKKRCENLVAELRALGASSSADYAFLPDINIFTKDRGGGFVICSPRLDDGIRWRKDMDAGRALFPDLNSNEIWRNRKTPMGLRLDGDWQGLLERLAEIEADPRAAAAAVKEERKRQEDEVHRARRQRMEEQLQREKDTFQDHAAECNEIRELVERITTVAKVRAMLELGSEAAKHSFYIAGGRQGKDLVPWVVLRDARAILADSVRFGGHIRGRRVQVPLHEDRVVGRSQDIQVLLERLRLYAENPGSVLAFGACCYCARPLTDDESRKRGYGPDCAATWRRPWGP